MRRVLPIALVLLAACASSPAAPGSQAEPEITIRQLSNVAGAARHMTGGVSVQYGISINNTTTTSLRFKRIDIQSVGMGAYSLAPTSKPFDVTLAPGETRVVELWAPAIIDNNTIVGANGPVTLRAVAHFESAAGQFQSVVVQQVRGSE